MSQPKKESIVNTRHPLRELDRFGDLETLDEIVASLSHEPLNEDAWRSDPINWAVWTPELRGYPYGRSPR